MSCMNRLAFLTLLAASAAWFGVAGADGAVDVSVLENEPDRVVIRYDFGAFTRRFVRIGDEPYAVIQLPGEAPIMEVGAPALPRVSRSIIIPDDALMAVRVLDGKYEEIADINIAPSKGFILRTVNPEDVPYTFGEVYETDAFYPGESAVLRRPYILRDHRGIVVTVNPFHYNPVRRVLRVYTQMTVEVAAVGKDRVNIMRASDHKRSVCRSFADIYRSHFINYDPGRYPPVDEEGDMLIIAYDAWVGNVQPLADHKTGVGIDTTVVPVSTAGSTSTQIKNYIQEVYDGGDLAFVLLVGDSAQVPSPYASGGASDPSYAKLAGSDDWPDIIVGRFSAENASQVDTQVQRTVEHENMPATEQEWFWKGMGVASNQGPGDDGEYDNEHIDNIRDDLLAYGYTEVDQIYDPYATGAMVASGLNEGRGIINYCGHGSTTSWSTTGFDNGDVNQLVNDNMLPFIVSVACVNGKFDGTTCFAEAWLRATHNGEPTGAVGAYMSSVNQSWNPPMEGQDEFNLLYVAEEYVTYGALCFAGSCSMMEEYGGGGVDMFNTWHVFGDPSLRVVGTVQPPTGMRVTPAADLVSEGPSGGPFTPDLIVYTVTNFDPSPIVYSVSKTQPWVDLSGTGGAIPVGGAADVTVSINSYASSLADGHYEDVVDFVNETNHDGDTTRLVSLEVGVPVPVITFDMDDNPGWTTQGLWAWGKPTGGGGEHGGPDPTAGYTGNKVYGYNLSGDYENYLSEKHLTTAAIDCSTLTQVQLKFWRWLGVEQPAYDHAYIRISNDGSNWTQIWENDKEITESSWSQHAFDIAAVADNQPTVYIRWTMGDTDSGWRYCGWNIDDVEIWAVDSSGSDCPEDVTGDDVVDVLDLLAVLAAWGDTGALPEDVTGDGVVDVLDLLAVLGAWGPCP